VIILNVSDLSDVCDFFVIATGTSPRQMRSVAADIVELADAQAFAPLHKPEAESDTWILVDCIDVIVHILSDDGRRYYDLDNLWGDAKRVQWEQK
jgi:ribosome-associated protein